MPPHRVQRMVQYSAPARPLMTRSKRSWPSQSGQWERTSSGELASNSCMAGVPLFFDDRALVEIIDPGLGVRDRRARVVPRETDFQFVKRDAVDDDRLEIRTPDPGVPEAPSSLESLDLEAVIFHCCVPGSFDCRGARKHESAGSNVNWFTYSAIFRPWRGRKDGDQLEIGRAHV